MSHTLRYSGEPRTDSVHATSMHHTATDTNKLVQAARPTIAMLIHTSTQSKPANLRHSPTATKSYACLSTPFNHGDKSSGGA
eukprot:scaffold31552_cov20-Tisochrysis_lutea.AAC.2